MSNDNEFSFVKRAVIERFGSEQNKASNTPTCTSQPLEWKVWRTWDCLYVLWLRKLKKRRRTQNHSNAHDRELNGWDILLLLKNLVSHVCALQPLVPSSTLPLQLHQNSNCLPHSNVLIFSDELERGPIWYKLFYCAQKHVLV